MVAGDPVGRWVPTGIEQDVEAVLPLLDDVAIGAVVLHGAAGAGKSALALAVMGTAEAAGRSVLRVVASPATTGIAFGALAPAHVFGDDATPVTAAPHPDASGADADGTGGSSGRTLLVIDDLPLLDAASADEIARLVREERMVVLATVRSGSSLPAAFDGLDVEGRVVRRGVGPLSPQQLSASAEAALGSPIDPSVTFALHGRSGGVALYARELLRANFEAGRLRLHDGVWVLDGVLIAPATLFDLVASRFLRLDGRHRRCVEVLSLAQPLSLDMAMTLVGAELLLDLEEGGLIVVSGEAGSTTVRLAHPLYAESVRAGMSPLRRRAASARAIDAAIGHGDIDQDLRYRLACLCLDDDTPLPEGWGYFAARTALSRLDPSRAERFIGAACDRSVDSLLLLGTALSALGRGDEADEALAEAWAVADSDELRARVLARRAARLGPGAGRFDEAVLLLEEGLGAIADGRWRAFVEAELAYIRSWVPERTRPVALASNDPAEDPAVRANECLVGAVLAAMAGDLEDVEPLVVEGLTKVDAIEGDVPHARDLLILSRFLARAFDGDAVTASDIAGEELVAAEASSSGAAGVWRTVGALRCLVDGDLGRTLADSAEAARELTDRDVAGLRPLALAVRSVAAARLGDVDLSRLAAAEVDPAWRDEVKVRVHLSQAAAWQEVALGRIDEGVEILVEAGQVGLAGGHLPFAGIALHDAVRLGRARGVVDLLGVIVDGWSGPLARALLAHAEVLAAARRPIDIDLDRLVAVAADLPGMGFSIAGATAWAQVAAAADAQGRDELGRRARLESARVRWRDLALPSARTGVLTARQMEVARAVAAGRTSREVALELGRSVRTVDNHLAEVFRKLGVSRRRDLAPLLTDLDAHGGIVT